MSEDQDEQHITRRDLRIELKSLRWEVRALVLSMVVVTNFDVPKEITAAAIGVAVGAAALKGAVAFIHN